MIRPTSTTSNQVILWQRPSGHPEQAAALTKKVESGTGWSPDDSFEIEPSRATLSERATFLAGRAWTCLTGSDYLEGQKASVRRLPPPEWYERFTSDNHRDRVEAYWENRDLKVGCIWLTSWDDFCDRIIRLQETGDLIELHFVLSHLYGDAPYDLMRQDAEAKAKSLAPERVKRRYEARILSKSFTSTTTIPGWCHAREAGFIAGAVDEIRKMYHSIQVCLENPGVKRKLELVPRSYYKEFLPKKSLSRGSLGYGAAFKSIPGLSLWQNFKVPTLPRPQNQRRPSEPEFYDSYEMLEWARGSIDW